MENNKYKSVDKKYESNENHNEALAIISLNEIGRSTALVGAATMKSSLSACRAQL